ncbi:right-handed parallel beta-helix repeat-containing protein [Alienimonas sp. DA493]|uniref:right-handed parallel beta-helix repeat-containing protein n=1 Tax=Alienimonas sp. DA493 TaxID=3373605 RepID=UPI003754F784
MTLLRSAFALCWLTGGCLAGAATAADLHVLPEGTGRKDGADWANALPADRLDHVFNTLAGPGDRVLLGSGRYEGASLAVKSGGARGRAKELRGVDTGGGLPVWVGPWSAANVKTGPAAIEIRPGVSDVTLVGLRLRNYQFGVRSPTDGTEPIERLTLEDVDAAQMRHHVYLSHCRDLTVRDCDAARYSKHAFRFEAGCRGVRVTRCTADCSEGDETWENDTAELIPFGFNVNDSDPPQGDFRFEDCVAANNRMKIRPNKYQNGDGFVVEGTVEGVSFLRCVSIRNRDGGYDLKPPVTLIDCVALENGRGLRLWSQATVENCFVADGETGLWSNGGAVAVRNGTFARLAGPAVMTDDKATGGVTLTGCLIASCGAVGKKTSKGPITLTDTAVSDTKPNPDAKKAAPADPAVTFVDLPADWPTAKPLPTHPAHGYRPPAVLPSSETAP